MKRAGGHVTDRRRNRSAPSSAYSNARPYPVEPRTLGAKTAMPTGHDRLKQRGEPQPFLRFGPPCRWMTVGNGPLQRLRPVQPPLDDETVGHDVLAGRRHRCPRYGRPSRHPDPLEHQGAAAGVAMPQSPRSVRGPCPETTSRLPSALNRTRSMRSARQPATHRRRPVGMCRTSSTETPAHVPQQRGPFAVVGDGERVEFTARVDGEHHRDRAGPTALFVAEPHRARTGHGAGCCAPAPRHPARSTLGRSCPRPAPLGPRR